MMASSIAKVLLRNTLIFVLLVIALTKGSDNCASKNGCGECIQTPGCQWCSQVSNTTNYGKCYQDDADLTDKCFDTSLIYVENPLNDLNITENVNLTEANSDDVDASQPLVQLQPQRVELKLRKDVPINITVKYRQAQDYPVDLYYLMDLSNSMKDDKLTVAGLGSKIAETLRSHTKQVRLGFGSFVDKVMLPYVDMSPDKLKLPCQDCVRPYSFRNDLPLNNDTESFKGKVNQIKMSGNMDSPEGGLDALMQVMKCNKEIGWSKARKIIVFSTDAKFHSAGDGRLAGIIDRNDETCHLDNKTGEYTHYMEVDYPSVGQINKVAKEEQFNIIFAVSNYEELYKLLSEEIEDSTYGVLSAGSNNVVELVEDQYLEISGKVELKDNTEVMDEVLRIDYFAKCPDADGQANTISKNNKCSNMKEGDEIEFILQVTLQSCPEESKFKVQVGTTQDKLVLEVEALCDCGCQKDDHPLIKRGVLASECNTVGTLKCGVCECNSEFSGNQCQCKNGENGKSTFADTSDCKQNADEEVCSDNGYCECGKCTCNQDYDGRFCQYDLNGCYSLNKVLCSGHGDCNHGKCSCNPGYEGEQCQCPIDDVCEAPGESKVCSGAGDCDCGECKCKNGTSGRFCEDCPACGAGKCQEYKDCVQFKGFQSGEIKDRTMFEKNCSEIESKMSSLPDLKGERDIGATLCTYNDEDDCTFFFTYHYQSTGTGKEKDYKIVIKEDRECPEPPNFLAIVLSVVATIVAIGLLTLLLWKIITTIHDRKEFNQFEEEKNKAVWNSMNNPIYKDTSTTIQNPGYGK